MKYENAFSNKTSSIKIPNTVEPEPDRLAYCAPNAQSCSFISPISGYAGITIDSKSFSISLSLLKFIVFLFNKLAKLIDEAEVSKSFLK